MMNVTPLQKNFIEWIKDFCFFKDQMISIDGKPLKACIKHKRLMYTIDSEYL